MGNRDSLTDLAGRHTFGYDALDQLTSAIHPAPQIAESFSYDRVGNRTRSHLSATHRHDAANRLLEDDTFTYTYDADGNRVTQAEKATGATTRYTFDAEDQLIRVDLPGGGVVQYRYDGLGRRIEKNVSGAITRYVYDNEDIILELDGENRTRAHWVHGPGIDEPLYMERDLNSNGTFEETERFFYHADGLGSIVAITNNTGQVVERYRYDSFGQPTILGPGPDKQMDTPDDVTLTESAYGNPYLFTSREWDPETGLYYYRARYLDPRAGTFLQEDPVTGSRFDPSALNKYPYAGNNPVNLTDPTGRSHGEASGQTISRLVVPGPPPTCPIFTRPSEPEPPEEEIRGGHRRRRPSARERHERGEERWRRDRPGGEKGDLRRRR